MNAKARDLATRIFQRNMGNLAEALATVDEELETERRCGTLTPELEALLTEAREILPTLAD